MGQDGTKMRSSETKNSPGLGGMAASIRLRFVIPPQDKRDVSCWYGTRKGDERRRVRCKDGLPLLITQPWRRHLGLMGEMQGPGWHSGRLPRARVWIKSACVVLRFAEPDN